MSQEILQSVQSKRSEFTAGNELARASSHVSSVQPRTPQGEAFAQVYDVITIDETTQFLQGAVGTHRMPSQHLVVDSFMVVQMNAPSAGTSAKTVGLNIVKRLIVRNGNTVQEILDYDAVMAFILSRLSPSQRQTLLSKVGGSSAVAETVIVPLPVFWSPFYTGTRCTNNVGLPLSNLNAPVELEITLAPTAELVAAGGAFAGAPYSSVKFVHLVKRVNADVSMAIKAAPWSYWCWDYQTVAKKTLTAGANNVIDLSQLDGSSVGLFLNPVLSSAIAANDKYTIASAIGRYEVFLNGASHLKVADNIAPDARVITNYLSFHFGTSSGEDAGDSTFAHNSVLIPFGASIDAGTGLTDDNMIKMTGFANCRDFTKIDLHLFNSNGSTVQTNVLNIRVSNYYIRDGYLNRRK